MADLPSVAFVDLTCRSPTYDARLGWALEEKGVRPDYWLAGCLPAQEQELAPIGPRRGWDIAGRIPLLVARLRKAAKTCEYVANVGRLNCAVRRGRYDIVHVQWLPLSELAPSLGRWEVRALRSGGTRVVLTVHNVVPHDSRLGGEQIARVYAEADALICHTRSARRRLSEELGLAGDRMRVIPHGPLEVGDSSPADRADTKRPSGREGRHSPRVLLFGFVRPYKGIELLLEAWRQVHRRLPEARLEIAGSGEAEYLDSVKEDIERMGLDDVVETDFRFLPEDELEQRIRAADVLVYPYRKITQSGALLAGLAAGKPVIASRLDGFEEIIRHGETGLLFQPGDRRALASALLELLESPEDRRRLGAAAAREVRDRFSWESIAERTLELYRDVVETGGDERTKTMSGERS